MVRIINLLTLATLGIIDFKSYKIPNVILCGWLGTLVVILNLVSTTSYNAFSAIVGSSIVAGSYIPLRRIVRCSPGDFKLFAVLRIATGTSEMLAILFITMIIALLPLAGGNKKVPIAFCTYFGYIAFLLMQEGSMI